MPKDLVSGEIREFYFCRLLQAGLATSNFNSHRVLALTSIGASIGASINVSLKLLLKALLKVLLKALPEAPLTVFSAARLYLYLPTAIAVSLAALAKLRCSPTLSRAVETHLIGKCTTPYDVLRSLGIGKTD